MVRRLPIFLIALVLPTIALAFPPPSVTGIEAVVDNGRVTVGWEAPVTGTISAYRIYYSQRSILQNGGTYDDVVPSPGMATRFTLPLKPPYPQIFIGVLAVNDKGEESTSFTEEVQLSLTGPEAIEEAPLPPESKLEPAHPTTPSLPSSGLPLVGIVIAGGAMAGLARMRRK